MCQRTRQESVFKDQLYNTSAESVVSLATVEYQMVDGGDSKTPLIRETRLIQEIEAKVTPRAIVCLHLGISGTPGSSVHVLPEGATNCVRHKCKLVSLTKDETLENHQDEWTVDSMAHTIQERKQK